MSDPRPPNLAPQPASLHEAEAWTVQRVLTWATGHFKERGFESPRLEAEVLLAHVLGVERIRLIIDAHKPLDSQELANFREAIKRRRSGEPVAYVVGKREFYGLTFSVNPRVLVPRPDTETLVEAALGNTSHRSLSGRALDLCTGSGCVAIAFAKSRPTWQVTGTDISSEAIEVARKNALRLGVIWAVRWLTGDMYDAVGSQERFELIVANPPYIPTCEIDELQKDVRKFEPRTALDGGPDGLTLLRRVISGATHRLTPGGTLAVELGAGQADAVFALFEAAGFANIERHKDYGGHERVVSGYWEPPSASLG